MSPKTELRGDPLGWVREHFAEVPFNTHLGMVIDRLEPGLCETSLPFRPQWRQQHGYYHGGVIGAMADTTAGHAALALLEPGRSAVTVEYKLNFLSPAEGQWLVARARVLKPGRTLIVSRSEVFSRTAAGETLCAIALVTYLALDAH